tara:strand:- start:193 stop:669 length:477 start_codon:yes stop_codon:yes gene_type:complete
MPDWTWKSKEATKEEVVIFDLDGVISDATHRQHFLKSEPKDWDGFFGSCPADPPIHAGIKLANLINAEKQIFILTARPISIQRETLDWLEVQNISWDALIMRTKEDPQLSPEMKRIALNQIREMGHVPILALDDDPRNIEMYKEESIPTIYLYSGYYE